MLARNNMWFSARRAETHSVINQASGQEHVFTEFNVQRRSINNPKDKIYFFSGFDGRVGLRFMKNDKRLRNGGEKREQKTDYEMDDCKQSVKIIATLYIIETRPRFFIIQRYVKDGFSYTHRAGM